MRVTKFDIECGNRLAAAGARRIKCPADVPVRDVDGTVTEHVTGPEAMALIDIKRLATARAMARDATQLAADQRKGDVLTAEQLAVMADLKARSAAHTAAVGSFKRDQDDLILQRGRWKPTAVHSPARAFASAAELAPTNDWLCQDCNINYINPDTAWRKRGCPKCHGPLTQVWAKPELAERWALVKARASARDGVQYTQIVDENGVWLRTVATTTKDGHAVGFGALLEIAHCAPTGPRDPHDIAVSREAVKQERLAVKTAQSELIDAVVARADTLRRVSAEVAAHEQAAKVRRGIAVVEATYGDCLVSAMLPVAPRRKSGKRGRRGHGNHEAKLARRAARRAGVETQTPATVLEVPRGK